MSVDMAIDCGPQVNPERIRAQLEDGAIMGLSLALSGEIPFGKGRVTQSNFHDYEVPRHNASPRTSRTHLVNDDHNLLPSGVGVPQCCQWHRRYAIPSLLQPASRCVACLCALWGEYSLVVSMQAG